MFENYKKLGLIIQTNPDSLKVLNEQNNFENVKISEVRRKIEYKPKLTMATDSENNVITKGTIVKIRDRNSPLRGQLGEIRAMFKDVLYLWIKNTMLQNSNGFYCVTSKQVINAGAQHLKEVNESIGLAADEIQANLDRQRRDTLLRNQLVLISRGPLKGYKGSVVFANEEKAEVHIHSKCMKITVPRQDIFILYNEMEGLRIQQNANIPVHLSFDEAANQEYVNAQEQDGWGQQQTFQTQGFGNKIK